MNSTRTAHSAADLVRLLDRDNLARLLTWLDGGGTLLLWSDTPVSTRYVTTREGDLEPRGLEIAEHHHYFADDSNDWRDYADRVVAVLETSDDDRHYAADAAARLGELTHDASTPPVWTIGSDDQIRMAIRTELASRDQAN